MKEVEFKGKKYDVRSFYDLRGDDWLHVAVTMESGARDAAGLLASLQTSIAIFVPAAAKRMREWPPQDILDFAVVIMPQVSAEMAEGPMVMQRYGDAFERLVNIMSEKYGRK